MNDTTDNSTDCGYIAFFEHKQIEIRAKDLYAAKLKAIELFKPSKAKQRLVSIVLAEKPDGTVIHTFAL